MDAQISRDRCDRPLALERQPDAALEQFLGVLPRSGHDNGGSPLPRTTSWSRGPHETRSRSEPGKNATEISSHKTTSLDRWKRCPLTKENHTMRLYDYAASGNCYKARLALALLERDYERV